MSSLRIDVSRGATPPFPLANIRGYGHSIAFGGNASRIGTTDFYARIRRALDPTQYFLSYTGHPSQWTAQMLPQAAADVDAFVVGGKVNIFLYMEVINSVSHYMVDLGMNSSDAAVAAIADHATMFTARRAAGYDICIAYTMYHPFGFNASQNTCCDLINAGLRAMVGTTLDAVIDVAVDPRFAITGPPGTSLTVADNTHPNDHGHQVIADLSLPVIYPIYDHAGGPTHVYSPNDISELIWWYEADINNVTFDISNKISLIKDKGTWLYDLSGTGAQRPTWNAGNSLYSGAPSIDAASNCMTTALNVDLTFTKTFQIVWLFKCTNTGPIMMEHSSNAGAHTDAWLLQYINNSTGSEMTDFGNVSNSVCRTTGPTTARVMSFIVDNTITTGQINILDELVNAAGRLQIDAPNTNLWGTYPLNLFARNTTISPGTISMAACFCFSRKLTTPELTTLIAYITAKWPH